MGLKKGDIVLVRFPFSDLSQTKLRPALVLAVSFTINEITLCFISSQQINNLSPNKFIISQADKEFFDTGLKVSSKVRVTKIITLERQFILRKLSSTQIEKLNKTIVKAFQID